VTIISSLICVFMQSDGTAATVGLGAPIWLVSAWPNACKPPGQTKTSVAAS
jgi:hypothetical protein